MDKAMAQPVGAVKRRCGSYRKPLTAGPPCRARGVDNATARQVLVYSFGAEVTAELPGADLRGRIQDAVNQSLAAVVPLAHGEASVSQAA